MYSRLDSRRFAFFLWLGTSGLHAKTQQSKRIPCRYTIEQQEFLFTYLRLPLGNGASPTGSAGTGTLFGLFAAVVGLVRPVGLLITVGEGGGEGLRDLTSAIGANAGGALTLPGVATASSN